MLKKFFPILEWLPKYRKKYLINDIIAGFNVGVILIPQGMAYALLAGLPPVYGLYAALTPQIIYVFLGTSRKLAVGPVAMDSILIASGLGAMELSSVEEYISMAIALTLLIGLIQFIMGSLKLGIIINLLSKPLINGFVSAVAIIICVNQLKSLLGVSVPQSNQIQNIIFNLLMALNEINYITFSIGFTSILCILYFKKFSNKIPFFLIIVIGGMVLTYLNNWSQMGVDIIGEIPEGLPNIKKPVLNPRRLIDLFPLAFTIALVAYMEAISISKSLEEKNKNYKINANQELIALGMSNIAGSFFQSFSTTGGFSRTAVNDASGAKTGVALLISALVVTIILIFFTSWFYYLPKTILSAIIIVSVLNLVDFKYSIVLFKKHKDEFFLLLSTFMITLFIGLKEGLLLGIMLSFLIVFFRLTSFPNSRILILDRIRSLFLKKQSIYFSKEGNNNYDIVLLDIKGQLFFGNIDYFKNFMYKIIKEKRPELKGIILNINNLYHIDSTGHDTLLKIVKKIQEKKVRIIISRNIEHERDVIFGYNLISLIKKKNIFNTSAEALKSFNKSKKNLPNEN